MAKLVAGPTIERLKDVVDLENQAWIGAEINFHVQPDPGDKWAPDFTAGCLLDGVRAMVPEAMSTLRKWDRDPDTSFYCYAPAGYLTEGVRMTLQVHPRDKKGHPTEDVIWQGDFRVHIEGDEYRVEPIT